MSAWHLLVAIAALLLAGNARAQDAGLRSHTISLPRLRPWPTAKWWSASSAVAGELPNPNHPRGTALILESAAEAYAPTLTEWDVLTGAQLRSVALPLPLELLRARVVRAGDRIHIFAYSRPNAEFLYLRLTPALVVESQEVLGTVDGMTVATDGSVIAVLWCGKRSGSGNQRGWQLVTLDATGNHLGAAYLSDAQAFGGGGAPLAVIARKVYVLLNDGPHALPPIMRFDAGARPEDEQPVTRTPDGAASLFAHAGGLFLLNGCSFGSVDPHWLVVGDRQPVPYRPHGDPWCPYFHVSSDGIGQLVTSRGDVLSTSFQVERHFADSGEFGRSPFWIGAIPALLVVDGKSGHLSMAWSD